MTACYGLSDADMNKRQVRIEREVAATGMGPFNKESISLGMIVNPMAPSIRCRHHLASNRSGNINSPVGLKALVTRMKPHSERAGHLPGNGTAVGRSTRQFAGRAPCREKYGLQGLGSLQDLMSAVGLPSSLRSSPIDP